MAFIEAIVSNKFKWCSYLSLDACWFFFLSFQLQKDLSGAFAGTLSWTRWLQGKGGFIDNIDPVADVTEMYVSPLNAVCLVTGIKKKLKYLHSCYISL